METTAGVLWEPADWAIALSDGFQWYDGIGFLPIIPASVGRHGGGIVRSSVESIVSAADGRVSRWSVEGSIEAAKQAAKQGFPILPGVFRYGSEMGPIAGYLRHHLWPVELGGPKNGWAIYVQTQPVNFHIAQKQGIQTWIDQQLMVQADTGINQMREFARANPDQLIPQLREIYFDLGIDFPY